MADFFAKGNKPISGYGGVDEGVIYSTEEHIIGKWIDGSTLYEKTVDCGVFPNATGKNVPHGISNLNKVINISGSMQSGTTAYPLPMVDNSNMAVQVTVLVLGDNVRIACGSDRSSYNGYVTLRYTKTS